VTDLDDRLEAAFTYSDDDDPEWHKNRQEPLDPWSATTGRDGSELRPLAAELDAFLSTDDPPEQYIVPNVLEAQDRVVVTGGEGDGKSTWLRQMGVQLAAGIHPFTLEPIPPLRVLNIDLENGPRHLRRKYNALRLQAGDAYKPTPGLFVQVRPGLDLLGNDEDRTWLRDVVASVQPAVLITGPVYKLAGGDPTEERTARQVTAELDAIRYHHGSAIILEAHTPYAATSRGKRPLRPYGASLWSRWPEFGIHLSAEGVLTHWRGPRDEREWPTLFQRGGTWPWTVNTRPRDQIWARVKELCTDAGDQLQQRDLAQFIGTSPATVNRAIREHAVEWDALAATDKDTP
jgi:AAA domain